MIQARARRLLRKISRELSFLAVAANHVEVVEDPDVGAAAIDVVALRLALNPRWCGDLHDDDLEFVLAHELMHVVLRTGPRGGGAEPLYWNFAHDLVINQRLTELLGRPPPKGGVTLPADERIDAETAYLRTRAGGFRAELGAWARTRWQVDAHADSSSVLANARAGQPGVAIASSHGVVSYVAVDYEPAHADEERTAIIEVGPPRRPWPISWAERLRAVGFARGRSWMRPSRRNELAAGRYRVSGDAVDVILDTTPAMLAHVARHLEWLRAFAADLGVSRLRLISVDERGVVADEAIDVSTWKAVRLPRALVIQRTSDSELRDGTWICKSCRRPHAAPRPSAGPAQLAAVDHATRAQAIMLVAPRVRRF